MSSAATRQPTPAELLIAAAARAPHVRRLTPEQHAELAQDRADIAAGRAELVAHEDVHAILERARSAAKTPSELDETEDDPVWAAFLRAPMGPPETEEERRLVEEAIAGGFVDHEVVIAELAERCRLGK